MIHKRVNVTTTSNMHFYWWCFCRKLEDGHMLASVRLSICSALLSQGGFVAYLHQGHFWVGRGTLNWDQMSWSPHPLPEVGASVGVGVGIQVWTKELSENSLLASLPELHPLLPFRRACVQSLHFWASCLQAWLILHTQSGSISATVLGYCEDLRCCPSTKEGRKHLGVWHHRKIINNTEVWCSLTWSIVCFCYHLEVGHFFF